MTKYVDYSSRVPAELRERALAANVIAEDGDLLRRYCTCGERRWGWMLHAGDCPVYVYHNKGGVQASSILEAILEEE